MYTRVMEWWPEASGPLLVHRLDLETSGLLLLAKSSSAHKKLQRQFISRSIKKTYEAVLEGEVSGDRGSIDLPLRVDLDDRPRQMVCHQHGKSAFTRWQKLAAKKTDTGKSRIEFSPITGRTHQLRVHAAHAAGLGMPIDGDSLYGSRRKNATELLDRLKLHATQLEFLHPVSGEKLRIRSEPPF